ncbi:MAG: hypothetical protein HY329_16160, partial [Chloroflexi bacterium]|nr:hypothetical protein [Chloroflexota bacterium]
LADLRSRVTPSDYATWLARTRLLAARSGTIYVGAPNSFTRRWLDTHFAAPVQRAIAALCGESVAVEFVVEREWGGGTR